MTITKEAEVLLRLDGIKLEKVCVLNYMGCSVSSNQIFVSPSWKGWYANVPCKKHIEIYKECGWVEYEV